ncbi:MAG: PAS domain S-box protein, partial [Alphaproteobacteria bacterium]
TVSVSLPDLAAAVAEPGHLVATRRADGRAVFAFAQPLSGDIGWYVVAERDSASVLGPVHRATLRFLGFSLLAVAALGLLMLLFWRHAATRRLAEIQSEQEHLIAKLARQSRFLEAATDAQPTEILVIDRQGVIRFANRKLREELGAESAEEVLDKPIEAVLGVQSGRGLRLVAEAAFEEGPLQDTQEVETEDGERRLYVINAVPLAAGEALEDAVCLLVREEVTSFVEERERRERTLKRLVATLAALIDARDPYAAKQSERAVEVASALANSLNLTLYETEAVEIAGRLMNIGKMLVPREILLKKGRLSEDELALVRNAMKKSADLLTGVEFDGPVVETLRQLHARVDGTGDPPLKGEEILITARILAVAN